MDELIEWVRLLNMALAILCACVIWLIPTAMDRYKATSLAFDQFLCFTVGAVYLWSGFASFEALTLRNDPGVDVSYYPVRVYGITIWLTLTLIALALRHRAMVKAYKAGGGT